MYFVPGEPLRAYSVGKLRARIRRRTSNERKAHRSVGRSVASTLCTLCPTSSIPCGKFRNSFLWELASARASSVRPCLRLFASPSSAKSTNELRYIRHVTWERNDSLREITTQRERERERERKEEEITAFAVNYPRNAREIVNGSLNFITNSRRPTRTWTFHIAVVHGTMKTGLPRASRRHGDARRCASFKDHYL